MKIPNGVQCQSCGSITRNDSEFFAFILPPSLSPLTGLPDGKFKGVATASNPRQLAELHACPMCIKKVIKVIKFTTRTMLVGSIERRALQVKSIGDTTILPPGQLRRILEQMKAKHGGSIAST